MYIAVTIVKVMILIAGLGLTAANFFPAFSNNDKPKLKKAGMIFLVTWVAFITLTIIEFAAISR